MLVLVLVLGLGLGFGLAALTQLYALSVAHAARILAHEAQRAASVQLARLSEKSIAMAHGRCMRGRYARGRCMA